MGWPLHWGWLKCLACLSSARCCVPYLLSMAEAGPAPAPPQRPGTETKSEQSQLSRALQWRHTQAINNSHVRVDIMIRAYKHFRKKLSFVKHESKFWQHLFILGHLRSNQEVHVLQVIPSLISDVIPELTEESGQDPIVEGVTFYVRYLGSCFVINKAGDEATSEAIKSIVSMVSKIKKCNIFNVLTLSLTRDSFY